MSPDIERYRRYVAHFDIPDTEKDELVHTVWNIMQSFVDRAFGDDPVQHCIELQAEEDTTPSSDVLDLNEPLSSLKQISTASFKGQ